MSHPDAPSGIPPSQRPARAANAPKYLLPAILFMSANLAFAGSIGLFTTNADIGLVQKPGSVLFDPTNATYHVSGGGENIWFSADAFQFVWREWKGDVSFAANIRWAGAGGHAHRKACLMIRQTATPDSPYIDAAVHGNGLRSLQFREMPGGATSEIQAGSNAPGRLQLRKRGNDVLLYTAAPGQPLRPAGPSFRMVFREPFLVGLGVCAHDDSAAEQAVFSQVDLSAPPPLPADAVPRVESTLEVLSLVSFERRVIYHTTDRIEAPNWSRNGQFLVFNSAGRLWKLPVSGGQPLPLDTGRAVQCNNDHGFSPDGSLLAFSDQTQDRVSRIYVLSMDAVGAPRLVTPLGPSYWHGWSPDSKTLAYCAERNREFDIYTIPVAGGEETRLTTAPGLDDGPDYSPDGRWIYFNSDRTGLMQIWRMKPDGSGQQQLTFDNANNWFPHPSPDGKWIVFLTYAKEVKGHPENREVELRLMPAGGGPAHTLTKLFGGQGTINVPSWAPDGRRFAFVSYQQVYP